MEIKQSYEVVIIGGGPAGLAAGLYCQRAGLKTILFEKGLIGGQIAVSKVIENYPGVEDITGFELAEKLVNHARSFGLHIVQEEVADIHGGRRSIRFGLLTATATTLFLLSSRQEDQYAGSGSREKPNIWDAGSRIAQPVTASFSRTGRLLSSEGEKPPSKRRCIFPGWSGKCSLFTATIRCGRGASFKTASCRSLESKCY